MPKIRELAVKYAPKSAVTINDIIKPTRLMDDMNFIPTSHAITHNYAKTSEIVGASWVNFDQTLPVVSSNSEIRTQKIGKIGGLIEIGKDALKQMGLTMAQYVASQMDDVTASSFMSMEQQFIYNVARQFAIDNGKAWTMDGSDNGNNKYNSIIAIRWQDGNACGLYDPKGFGQGMIFDVEQIANGGQYKLADGSLGYGASLVQYLGFLIANKDNIAVICNVPNTTPGASLKPLVNGLSIEAKIGLRGDTTMYLSPKLKARITDTFKDSVATGADPRDINRTADSWNRVPLVESWNFTTDAESYVPNLPSTY